MSDPAEELAELCEASDTLRRALDWPKAAVGR